MEWVGWDDDFVNELKLFGSIVNRFKDEELAGIGIIWTENRSNFISAMETPF
jgi:hypothetical protein